MSRLNSRHFFSRLLLSSGTPPLFTHDVTASFTSVMTDTSWSLRVRKKFETIPGRFWKVGVRGRFPTTSVLVFADRFVYPQRSSPVTSPGVRIQAGGADIASDVCD